MTASHRKLIGVTGHQAITTRTRRLVQDAIRSALQEQPGSTGITSLAAGADQIFAQTVLELGGQIFVVLPAKRYEESFDLPADRANFRRLLNEASEVFQLPFDQPSEEAYWAAGQAIVNRAQHIFAVWDGLPAGGLGGTAEVVAYARKRNRPVTIIWPEGSSRA